MTSSQAMRWYGRSVCREHTAGPLARLQSLLQRQADLIAQHAMCGAVQTASDHLPSYPTADLGLRCATEVSGHATTLRPKVNTLTNKNHWMNCDSVGAPRSVAFSAQLQF
jgi:hypothetical protein